jgi:hypothetical protein
MAEGARRGGCVSSAAQAESAVPPKPALQLTASRMTIGEDQSPLALAAGEHGRWGAAITSARVKHE